VPEPFNKQWDAWTPEERWRFLVDNDFLPTDATVICQERWDRLDDLDWNGGSLQLTEEIQIAADKARQVA
jgi:hypothetical protein